MIGVVLKFGIALFLPQLRHKISITSKDWPGSQSKLNSEAAEGYRVVSLTITGKEIAEVELLRADAIAD
jgi:hypothetical protein